MAGVKGRSGGARPNTGGRRPGAGRKPKIKPAESSNLQVSPPSVAGEQLPASEDPLDFLLSVQNSPMVDIKTRVRAAIAAAQYKHTKRGDGGIKDGRQDAAKKAGAGKFGASAPPLKVVGGSKA